eukprot:TRINITY_DN5664_c0_g2_i1.p1 TRINITY_DN5664_c0_g2~~TRINITY_DN5664_c0_g2_i1.p1  ORF type:complete len:955 (+),score=232.86 TRINITY_DN5664_c0_g2_i1:103-2967(+)
MQPDNGKPEGERRRRRRDEGEGDGKERRRRRDTEGGQPKGNEDQQRERRRRREAEAEKVKKAPAAEEAAAASKTNAAERRSSGAKTTHGLGLTYTAFCRQRRALDRYEKKCTYDQLLDKLHTDQFIDLMGGKLQDKEHARSEKERCKNTEVMAKRANPNGSSAGIMADFYSTLLTWGGVPVPDNIREIVDDMEKRYRAEKKAEREQQQERQQREAEARREIVEEAAPEPDEEDEYKDDEFEKEEEEYDADRAIIKAHINQQINQQINQKMQDEYTNLKISKKARDLEEQQQKHKRAVTPTAGANLGVSLPEQHGPTMAQTLSSNKKKLEYEKQFQRAQEILQWVPLEMTTYTMLEVQPCTEYDIYMRNFGLSNSEQASTQVPDDAERDSLAIQTDPVTHVAHGCQAPEDLGVSTTETALEKRKRTAQVDSSRLLNFVSNCSVVFSVLLDEAATSNTVDRDAGSNFKFSSSVVQLKTENYIADRGTIGVSFSRSSTQYLVTIHGKLRGNESSYDTKESQHRYDGLCLVWNINNPSTPDKICSAGSQITTGCFSPHNGYLFYGGSSCGAIFLWDLRERDYLHNSIPNTNRTLRVPNGTKIRLPTYSTENLIGDNHSCKIRRVLPIGYNNILIGAKDADSNEQVVSLDEMGNISIWIVVEIRDKRAFEKDFGLNIGSSMRLFKSATVSVNQPMRGEFDTFIPKSANVKPLAELDPFQPRMAESPSSKRKQSSGLLGLTDATAFDLEFQPNDASQFLVATDTGNILHASRFGEGATPARYRISAPLQSAISDDFNHAELSMPDPKRGTLVLSIHYSETDNRLFLAALNDGSINIYKTSWGSPLFTLEDFTHHPIIVARWSRVQRGVIWALDSSGVIHIFDLIEDDHSRRQKPILSQDCCIEGKRGKSIPNDIDFSFDERQPKLAISYSCGRVDVHILKDSLLSNRTPSSTGSWLNSFL